MADRPVIGLPDPSLGSPRPVLPRSALFTRLTVQQAEEILRQSGALQNQWFQSARSYTEQRVSWEDIKSQMQPGDELWTYETWAECDYKARASDGLALVRKRKPIAHVQTHVRRFYF